jgi:hypothetical protein
MTTPALPPARLSPRCRDALAVLSHVFLRFDRATEARALLAALDADGGDAWARRALCLAQLQAGDAQAALDGAVALLADPGLDDELRLPLLHVAAKASWRLGRPEEARAHRAAAIAAGRASLRPPRREGAR